MEAKIPNAFWKYYDLYRRGKLTVQEFSVNSGLTKEEIKECLELLNFEKA